MDELTFIAFSLLCFIGGIGVGFAVNNIIAAWNKRA
jgi:hypothetical protein